MYGAIANGIASLLNTGIKLGSKAAEDSAKAEHEETMGTIAANGEAADAHHDAAAEALGVGEAGGADEAEGATEGTEEAPPAEQAQGEQGGQGDEPVALDPAAANETARMGFAGLSFLYRGR